MIKLVKVWIAYLWGGVLVGRVHSGNVVIFVVFPLYFVVKCFLCLYRRSSNPPHQFMSHY